MRKKVLLSVAAAVIALFCTAAAANAADTVTVSAYDYTAHDLGVQGASQTGVVLENYTVTLKENDTAAAVALRAFDENGIKTEGLLSGYLSKVNELGEKGGYSGWCFAYNNDDYTNFGLSSVKLAAGDNLRFDYSCNFDKTTDDIGNGWSGLPIITQLKTDGKTQRFGKKTAYDAAWNVITNAYRIYDDNETAALQGGGTADNPFVLNVVSDSENTAALQIETSVNAHYRTISGLDENSAVNDGDVIAVSTLGEKYKAYYKIYLHKLSGFGAFVRLNGETAEFTYYNTNSPATAYLAKYSQSGKLTAIAEKSLQNGCVSLSLEENGIGSCKAFLWKNSMPLCK